MKMFVSTTLVLNSLAAAALMLAVPAGAAPSAAGSAQDVVNELQTANRKVVVTRVGTGPLETCAVTEVRPGRPVMRLNLDRTIPAREVVDYIPVHVAVKC